MEDANGDFDTLLKTVRSEIDKRFNAGFGRVYLSTLGSDLSLEKRELEALSGQKFSEILRDNLPFVMGRTGEHENVLFLVPEGVSVDENNVSQGRFVRSFWLAFAVPLSGEGSRYVNLKTLKFSNDRSSLENQGGEVLELESHFIATNENSGDRMLVTKNIESWVDQNDLDVSDFIFRRNDKPQGSRTALSIFLSALNDEQSRRTSLTADVVKALSKLKV